MAKKNPKSTKKSLPSRQQGVQFKDWRQVAVATAANAADLPGSATQLLELQGVIGQIDTILARQSVFQASKQSSSQELKTLMNKAGKLATVLKAVAKQHFGHGNDKLVEFGIQPFRSRPKPTVVPPTAPPPVTGTPAPTPIPPSSK